MDSQLRNYFCIIMLVQREIRHLLGLYFLSQNYLDPDLLYTLVISHLQTMVLNLPFGS